MMHFSVHDVLSQLSNERAVAPRMLQQKLGLAEAEGERLQIVLDALEKLGLVEKSQGRYRRLEVEDLVSGRLRCSSKGLCFVVPDDPAQEEVVVEGGLKNAWNGDRLVVRLLKRASRRRKPEGEVVVITERTNSTLIGRVSVGEDGLRTIVPLDERLGGPLELDATEDSPALEGDQIVQVRVARYPLGRRPARTRLERILGRVNEPQIDIDLICNRYQIPTSWPQAVQAAVLDEPADLFSGREDLRALAVFALPGRLAQLAASATPRREGGWHVGLHLSDLTPFVAEGSPLDREAAARGGAVTLRDRQFSLWPAALIERTALVPGADRCAWSLMVDLDASGIVLSYRLGSTCVRIQEQLADGALPPGPLADAARAVAAHHPPLLAPADSPQVFVELLENLIARHLAHLHLTAPYLSQSAPDGGEMVDWIRLARANGVDVPEGETVEAPTLEQFRQWLAAEPVRRSTVLRELLVKTLPPVDYTATTTPYFSRNGIAAPFATPLERYADLLVQRLLARVFEEGRDRKSPRSKVVVDLRASSCHGLIDWAVLKPKTQKDWEETLPGLLVRLAERGRQVEQAHRDMAGFDRLARLIGQVDPLSGLITGVQSYGFFVAIEEPFIEGLVHVSGLRDDWYTYQAREPALIGRRNRKRFQIGDAVRVRVKSIDYYRQQVDLMVLREAAEPSEEAASTPVALPEN